jgi:hypothetical protein
MEYWWQLKGRKSRRKVPGIAFLHAKLERSYIWNRVPKIGIGAKARWQARATLPIFCPTAGDP